MSDAENQDDRRRPDWRGPVKTVRLGVALVHSAAPRELWLTLALTVFGALLTAAELLVGRELVNLLVDADDATASELVPWLVLLGLTLVATALVTTGLNELRILTAELVHRRAMDQLLEVTTAVELEAFEDPTFHDRIRLAREHADTYAWEVVWGLVTLMTTAFQSIAVGLGVAERRTTARARRVRGVRADLVRQRPQHQGALPPPLRPRRESDRDRTYHERLLTDRLEAREVRAFGLAGWLRARHDALFAERVRNTRQVVKRRTLRALVGSSITSVILVASLAAVMLFALDDRISVADATIAIVALQQLSSRLRSSGGAMESLVEGVTYLRDFETFRALLPAIATGAATRRTAAAPTEIALHGVGYRYPAGAHDVLQGVDLTIRPGQVIAIVGPNGAGKSTLAKLLCGLLPPASGRISWDGVDIAEYSPASVRAQVTPVFQDFTRFEHSAREAIGFGDIDRLGDDDGIRRAAQRAGADGFIEELPAGYDTRLSTSFTDGIELSVGQWQRVAVARAFFRDAPLVVMDEPAAALDALAERDLFERLALLGRDRMVVFISHRFATVRRADQILVLLDGRVVERGAHDELMALGGVYAELYSIQSEQFG